MKISRREQALLRALARGKRFGHLLEPLVRRLRGEVRALRWRSGLSVIIPERDHPQMLAGCLEAALRSAAEVAEECEIIVVVNGASRERYSGLVRRFPTVRWRYREKPLGFVAAVRLGLRAARHGGVYLLNSDMVLEPGALREVLRWRAPHVFAVASQIFFTDATRRREETGWTDLRIRSGRIEIFDVEPEDELTVRGHLYAGGGSSLFNRAMLRRMVCGSDPYHPFYWEDAEWGLRAWRAGYEVLFCPASRAWHHHRATVSRFYEREEIERIFQRNAFLFQLRNFPDLVDDQQILARLRALDARSRAEILTRGGMARALIRLRLAPCRTVSLRYLPRKFYPAPPIREDPRPGVLFVSPYAIFPPTHGGAVRMHRLLLRLAEEFRLVVLSDEENLIEAPALRGIGGLDSVHLVGGRREPGHELGRRIERIRNHSHQVLRHELERLLIARRPDLVQIEFIELSDLVGIGKRGRPWILTLHDVLLGTRDGGDGRADRYELARIRQHDAVVVCSREDEGLLDGVAARLVPNGCDDDGGSYRSSKGARAILFCGPFRYAPNFHGVRLFAERVFPELRARVEGARLTILAGPGGGAMAGEHPCFAQPGVEILEFREDIRALLDGCALTINPLEGTRGSSLKLLESVAAGRVCVSTVAGARGWTDAGFPSLVTVKSIEDFLDPIELLLRDEGQRLELERPPLEALRPYRWEECARALASLYHEQIRR